MCDVVRIYKILLKTIPLHPGISQKTPLVGTSKVAPLVGYHHGTKANQSMLTVAAAMMLPKLPECKADVGHHLLGSISPLMFVQHHNLWSSQSEDSQPCPWASHSEVTAC